MTCILVTGATGYLGSRILRRLTAGPEPYEISIIKRSTSNTAPIAPLLSQVQMFDIDKCSLPEIFEHKRYDVILHCATNYGRRDVSNAQIVEANLHLPLSLLELGLSSGIRAFVNTDTLLDKNVSAYTLSKRHFREWMQALSQNISTCNVALEHFFGPRDDPSKFVSFVLQSLISNQPVIDLTEGDQRRDFVYIDDVVDAFMCILMQVNDQPAGYCEFEVGSGCSVSIREFVETAAKLCGNSSTELAFGAIKKRENEPLDVRVDISRLQTMGWSPKWNLSDALTETIRLERET